MRLAIEIVKAVFMIPLMLLMLACFGALLLVGVPSWVVFVVASTAEVLLWILRSPIPDWLLQARELSIVGGWVGMAGGLCFLGLEKVL